jgi:hypothetical protein
MRSCKVNETKRNRTVIRKLTLLKGKDRAVGGLNQAACYEDVCGSGGTAPLFLTKALDGGESLVSSPYRFTVGGDMSRRLGGAQSRSGRRGEENVFLPLPEIRSRFFGCPTRS